MNFLHPDESPAGAHGAPFGGETSASPSRLNHVDLGLHPRPPTPLDPSELLDDAIVEEYRAWKKNVPYLYDLMVTHELEWPSLTCEWLPTLVKLNKFTMHKLLLGTHTAEGEMNQLVLTQVYFPNDGATAEGGEGKVHRVPGILGLRGLLASSGFPWCVASFLVYTYVFFANHISSRRRRGVRCSNPASTISGVSGSAWGSSCPHTNM